MLKEKCFTRALRLLESGSQSIHYYMPFPIGVFGTLRKDQGNSQIMYARDPTLCCKAFLPNITTNGITLEFQEGASAAFEVFFYEPKNWMKVIEKTDYLEGFMPELPAYYQRTLAVLRILPDDYENNLFNQSIDLNPNRSLEIPKETWLDYPSMPTWIYSNVDCNTIVQNSNFNPIKWWK